MKAAFVLYKFFSVVRSAASAVSGRSSEILSSEFSPDSRHPFFLMSLKKDSAISAIMARAGTPQMTVMVWKGRMPPIISRAMLITPIHNDQKILIQEGGSWPLFNTLVVDMAML